MAGGAKIGFSNATYLSERQTADRNYALAYFMVNEKQKLMILHYLSL